MGSFQVCDDLSILFKFEKPLIEHLEGFIILLRKGGELPKKFKIFDQKFKLKNSKEFPHWISKAPASMVEIIFVVTTMSC
jgi:hypothetical protein